MLPTITAAYSPSTLISFPNAYSRLVMMANI